MNDKDLEYPSITRCQRDGYPNGYTAEPETLDVSEEEFIQMVMKRKEREMAENKKTALAQKAVGLAILISTETTTDVWFKYSGHVDTITVHYAPNGWNRETKDGDTEYIFISEPATVKNLQYAVDCFEFIYAVAERT